MTEQNDANDAVTCVILRAKIIIKIYLSENKEVTLLMQQNW